jgi:hypothetical protein
MVLYLSAREQEGTSRNGVMQANAVLICVVICPPGESRPGTMVYHGALHVVKRIAQFIESIRQLIAASSADFHGRVRRLF